MFPLLERSEPTASVARPGVPRPRSKTRLRGTSGDADAPAMRTYGRSTLQMSWLATALAGVLGIVTPAIAHLAAERTGPTAARVEIASAAAGLRGAVLHERPPPTLTVVRPGPQTPRRHPANAKGTVGVGVPNHAAR